MVSRKNATSASDRVIPSCRPTALSSSDVGSFALATMPSLMACLWVTGEDRGLAAGPSLVPADLRCQGAALDERRRHRAHRILGLNRRKARALTEASRGQGPCAPAIARAHPRRRSP